MLCQTYLKRYTNTTVVKANELENETQFPLPQKSQVSPYLSLSSKKYQYYDIFFTDSMTLCNKSTKIANNRPKHPIKRKSKNQLASYKKDT